MSDQGTGQPLAFPSGATTDPVANGRHKGQMPRWATASATIASFATQTVAGHSDVYVPLATASLAGSLSAADFNKTHNWPIQRLDYNLPTDSLPGAIAAGTWADITANQSFAVNSTTSHLIVSVRCGVLFTSAALCQASTRVVFDSAGTPVTAQLGVDLCPAGGFGMVGGNAFAALGLAAGTHTVKVQVAASQNFTPSCHASTQPNYEYCNIHILELTP